MARMRGEARASRFLSRTRFQGTGITYNRQPAQVMGDLASILAESRRLAPRLGQETHYRARHARAIGGGEGTLKLLTDGASQPINDIVGCPSYCGVVAMVKGRRL